MMLIVANATAQRRPRQTRGSGEQQSPAVKPPAVKEKLPIIFAVINDGQTLEPIALVNKGRLEAVIGGDAEGDLLSAFVRDYYAPNTAYRIIFGGADAGATTVKEAGPASDCARNLAQAAPESDVKFKGFVMGLATDAPSKSPAAGARTRRPPTPQEKAEIEMLVRATFAKQKTSAAATKTLHYHNLTAVDVDNDGKIEFIGSYWIAPTAKERRLLFFIAVPDAAGKLSFAHSEYNRLTPDKTMSGDFKATDTAGVYHELLLDVFDYDGDGTSEIFTIGQGYEGNSFNVYRRDKGKWTKAFEGSNYHCAY